MDTKEYAAKIREDLKNELPFCKFNVTMSRFAGGSSICARVMVAPFEVFEVPHASHNFGVTAFEHETDRWANGTQLTEAGWNLMQKMAEIVNRYHESKHSSSGAYLSLYVNFYADVAVGRWDKPFEVKK